MSGEFTASKETKKGYFTYTSEKTGTKKLKELEYGIVDGFAMFEGDIILGTEEKNSDAVHVNIAKSDTDESLDELIVISGEREPLESLVIGGISQNLWPEPVIPYTIDPELHKQEIVEKALVEHWEKHTVLSFIQRKDEEDYIIFRPGKVSRSFVGCRGGQQFIELAPNFATGTVIHEVGHAVGLWHEQSREDRDQYVKIHFENILPNCEHNFTQRIANGDDVGLYDYESIMHYPSFAFSRNNKDTITAPQGVKIGQRNRLSEGDIAGINGLYGHGLLLIGNSRSKVFHKRDCSWVGRMNVANRRYFTALDQANNNGYHACRSCFAQ